MRTVTYPQFYALLLLCCLVLATGCQEQPPAAGNQQELLIYCGITMGKPLQVLAARFEKQKNCRIKIIQGGSGNLYQSITINRSGDLYLPGSASYIEKCRNEQLVTDSVSVGSNRATLVVAEGNPLAISNNLDNLLDSRYRIVLGSADSGSIGRETKRILSRHGIYAAALDRTLYLSNDSKDLTEAIRSGNADLTINWQATTYWDENRDLVDAIPLPEDVAPAHELILGLLSDSKHPELAKEFMTFAASIEGQSLFDDFGLSR